MTKPAAPKARDTSNASASGTAAAGTNKAASWDNFWQGYSGTAAWASSGTQHPAAAAFWQDTFATLASKTPPRTMLDVASGGGAVLELATSALPDDTVYTCVDVSPGAIAALQQRFPQVDGVVADAAQMPVPDARFDLVTSQFGVEYAGTSAFAELLRVLAPGGTLALLLHHRKGGIHKESSNNLDAVRKIQQSKLLNKCQRLFTAGFAALAGGPRQAYDDAGKRLQPAIRTLETVLQKHGQHVAGDTLMRLHQDIQRIHQRLPQHDPAEVQTWLAGMASELDSYAERMGSMCAAALDARSFTRLTEQVQAQQCSLVRAEPLTIPEHPLPLGWVLVAHRA